jgi:hypothetical protein
MFDNSDSYCDDSSGSLSKPIGRTDLCQEDSLVPLEAVAQKEFLHINLSNDGVCVSFPSSFSLFLSFTSFFLFNRHI